ncbi:MAG TPA: prephenate dehydratase [Negativicutes bacterium]|nr:prephenate dehydratase [Negativicutes bacterium]
MHIGEGKSKYRVGFLGPQGTYSQEAAQNIFGDSAVYQPYPSIDAAIRAVAAGEIPECVVPIENSLEGSVNVTLDTLAHEVELLIAREIVMPIRHNLLAREAGRGIQLILSHPQALAQCRKSLARLFPIAEYRAVESTAEAARRASEGEAGLAAIGSRTAADLYGLDVVAADIQDTASNCTRFVTLKVQPADLTESGRWKTSIVCKIDGSRPGSLYRILSEFADREVNLTKIESRPARTGLGAYLFFLDMEGGSGESRIRETLAAVEKQSFWFKNLGSYLVMEWDR